MLLSKPKVILKEISVVVVTHRSILPCIPGDDLARFLARRRCSRLLYIKHPLLILKESRSLSSGGNYYENRKLIKSFSSFSFRLPESVLYLKDLILTLFWVLSTKQNYDLYFGMNNLNALAGIVLKMLGRVKKVVYYTIDLYPQRFSSSFINWIYHKLDKFCVRYCDETWNVSPFLVEYREKRGMAGIDYSRQFTVPIGIWFNEMERIPTNKVKRTKIVYVGHLKALYGVDLAIRALPLIEKKISNINFGIIGGGEQKEELQELAKKLGVSDCVKFYGWKEKKEAEKLLTDAAIGLAPFNTNVDEKIKNADPAKIKDYLALGLPVVMTNASLNASTIAKLKCGIVIDYTTESLANAAVKLLSDEQLWKEYRNNALRYVKQFDWNVIFTKNIARLLN